MPYVGKAPVGGGFHKLDNLTASATATYALTLGSAAYYPETANQLLVSLNGVIQAPQDSFTVSGSNLIFDSALTASDSIDFVVALGDVLGVGSVTDGAITTAKLGNNAVTDAKIDTMAATKLTGTINNSRMPVGSVVQTLYARTTTATSITSTTKGSGTSTGLSLTITPHSISNKLLINYVGSFQLAQHSNPSLAVEIYDGSSVVETDDNGAIYINGDGDEYGNKYKYPLMAFVTPSSSGAITYTIRAWKSGNAVTAQQGGSPSHLSIQEIKQ